ncbi:MAG: tetratricopeptide (TPR) repeat protein [Kiritimatiellia bacterium]|jgi:tetratricopeptide (TPR) repeat protein
MIVTGRTSNPLDPHNAFHLLGGLGWLLVLILAGALQPIPAQVPPAPAVVPALDAQAGSQLNMGRMAFNDGSYALAIEKLEAFLKNGPPAVESAEALVLLARSHEGAGAPDKAIEVLRDHAAVAEQAKATPTFAFWIGMIYFSEAAYDKAIGALTSLKASSTNDPYFNRSARLQARCLIKQEKYIEALTIFNKTEKLYANKQDPDAAQNFLDWAGTLIKLGRHDEAKEILHRLTAGDLRERDVQQGMLWLARLRVQDQQFSEAELILKDLTLAEVLEPANRAMAWFAWAELNDARGETEEALTHLLEAEALLTDKKQLARIRMQRAKVMIKSGALVEGAALLREEIPTISTEASASEVQLQLSQALLERELFEDAEKAFQAYIEAYPDPLGEARMGRAWALSGLEKYTDAAAAFDKAYTSTQDPVTRRLAFYKTADAWFDAGNYAQAEEVYRRFTRAYPSDDLLPQAIFQIALCKRHQEFTPAAQQEFSKLMAVFPESPFAERAHLQKANILQEQDHWALAIRAYTDYLSSYPEGTFRADGLFNRAYSQYFLAEFQAAHDDFKRVVDEHPDDEVAERAYYMRGWSLYLMGRDAEALAICEEFLSKYTKSAWADDVLFWLAKYHYDKADYAAAEKRFLQLATSISEAELADEAWFMAGRAAANQKEYRRAVDHFGQLTKGFKSSPLLAEAYFYQGDAFTQLGSFSQAILFYEQVIKDYPQSYVVYSAWGRKGDCQFTLGEEEPTRYKEALQSYQVVLDSPAAPLEMRVQAEYKMGTAEKKLGNQDGALDHYNKVVYSYMENRDKLGNDSIVFFTRAAFAAADILIERKAYNEARSVYRRVIQSGVNAAGEARKRLEKLSPF